MEVGEGESLGCLRLLSPSEEDAGLTGRDAEFSSSSAQWPWEDTLLNGKTRLPEIQLCVWKVFSRGRLEKGDSQNSPEVQRLRLCASTAGSTGLILIRDLRSCIAQHS